MGQFCAKSENDELILDDKKQTEQDMRAIHYSQRPEKLLSESGTMYQSVHVQFIMIQLISDENHKVERCQRFKKNVVIKKVEKNIFQRTEQIEMQKQILLNVRFPFICKLIQYQDSSTLCLFELESCICDLQTYLFKHKLNYNQLQFIISQVVLAINEIHKSGYIYRALHLSHILIADDGYIRLIGFGHSSNTSTCPIVTNYEELRILPPETLYGIFDQAGDWWSLGSLMYKIITEHYPFENAEANFDQLREAKESGKLTFSKVTNPNIQSFIIDLLSADTKKRLSNLQSIMKHIYFEHFDWEKLKSRQLVSPLIL